MSATDSDNSIDWLASDNEDEESEREADCAAGKLSQTEAPLSPRRGPSESKEGDSSWSRVSRGSPSSCTDTWDRDAFRRCQTPRGGKAKHDQNTQQALKRPHSATAEERKERQLFSNQSEKERNFTRKCMELQCYIHPLSSILNGLRSGRYRQRLSSFQESVAMDRIQRIMGVLQKPCMGEKYVNIILKMEEMLKSWFPNVNPQDQLAVTQTQESTSPTKKLTVTQTQEAVPTKKLKLSPLTTALASAAVSPGQNIGAPPVGAKVPRVAHDLTPPGAHSAVRVTDLTPPGAYSASNLKWLHTSPICSATAEQAQAGPRHSAAPPRDRELTQDNAVSSSTDSHAKMDSLPPRGPPPLGKINAPCLERLLKSTESIITRKGTGAMMGSSWS